VRYRPDAGCAALGRCVRTLRLEQLTDLDLAHGAVLAGVDPGKCLERHTLGPVWAASSRVAARTLTSLEGVGR
jgi:hypothetical protein